MEENNKKSLIRTAIILLIVVAAANLGPKLFNSKKELALSNENTIEERARIMNNDCPFTIDTNTRLDSVSSPEKNVLRQNYTLLSDSKSDIDIETFQNIFKPEIKKNLNREKQTEYFKSNNAKLVYRYYDKEKNFVTDIIVNPNEY